MNQSIVGKAGDDTSAFERTQYSNIAELMLSSGIFRFEFDDSRVLLKVCVRSVIECIEFLAYYSRAGIIVLQEHYQISTYLPKHRLANFKHNFK